MSEPLLFLAAIGELMNAVTRILLGTAPDDPSVASQLLPLVYDELRRLASQRLAAERPDHTLQATALVHEAYVRLVGGDQTPHWDGRGHSFAAAAEAMRRILTTVRDASGARSMAVVFVASTWTKRCRSLQHRAMTCWHATRR